jgi:hypothetical protein
MKRMQAIKIAVAKLLPANEQCWTAVLRSTLRGDSEQRRGGVRREEF